MEETNLFNNLEKTDVTVLPKDEEEYSIDFNLTEKSSTNDILDYVLNYLIYNINKNEVAFKGGYLLSKILPSSSRKTMDIDFSISVKEYYNNVKLIMDNLGKILYNNNIISEYNIKDSIEETQSGGITFYLQTGEKMGIDVGLHPLNYGIRKWNIEGKEVNGFEIERMLADKFSAIYSRKRFRRSKDLYDFYIITDSFDVDLEKLNNYISKRCELDINNSPLQEIILVEYKKAYDKLKVEFNNITGFTKPEFNKIIERLQLFEIYLINKTSGRWSHELKIIQNI